MSTEVLIIALMAKKTIHAHYSTLSEEIMMIYKAPKFKAGDRIRITKYKSIFSNSYNNHSFCNEN